MAELDENFFKMTKKIAMGLVVALFVITGSQMAVHSPFSELRNPMAVGTWWVGLASTPHPWPSQDKWIQVLSMVVQGLKGVR